MFRYTIMSVPSHSCVPPLNAHAQNNAELDEIRQQIKEIKQGYEKRIDDLKQGYDKRIDELERRLDEARSSRNTSGRDSCGG